MFTWCNGWIFSKLRMHIRMPTAHIMAMSIKVGKASIEIILCHSDQTMQKVEQFGRPIGILFQIKTRKCVIARTIPGHQPCFVLPLSTNFDLKIIYILVTKNDKIINIVLNNLVVPAFEIKRFYSSTELRTFLKTTIRKLIY